MAGIPSHDTVRRLLSDGVRSAFRTIDPEKTWEQIMDLELKGKRAFVSGSSSGLGKAIALELAAEGCDLVVHGRDRARTEETAREIKAKGVKVVATFGDLARDADANRIADDALAGMGAVDIRVNNCGAVLRMDNPEWSEVKPQEWIDSFQVNFVSGLRLSQRFVPAMKEQRWGRVINISSTGGSHVDGVMPDYCAPKAALNNFTANLSKSLGPFGITVNGIIPGTHLTPAVERWIDVLKQQKGWGDDFEENRRRYTTELLPQSVHRLGKPREVAVAVAFLASPLSSYTNGAFLRIDGGMARFV
jgi:3-oxoacyl-[acyl-carrier protein] reductase